MSATTRTMLDHARDALGARMAKDDLRLVLENVITYAATLETRLGDVHRMPQDNLTPAEVRLGQYSERTKTWSTATYDSGTERALHEIACALRDTLEEVRDQRNAARLKVMGLEAERHSTNEALDDAVQALRTRETSPLTVYRASHDSIVMGLYTTAAAAREHCETEMRREYDETTKVSLWWREDEDTVDQPEDGEQELFVHATPAGMSPGRTWGTGYVVTPLEVAAAYDAEADE